MAGDLVVVAPNVPVDVVDGSGAREFGGASKDGFEHRRAKSTGERVSLARMECTDHAVGADGGFRAMPELLTWSRLGDRLTGDDRPDGRVPGERAEGDDDADSTKRSELADKVRGAVVTLDVGGAVHRRRAPNRGGDVEVGQDETIIGPS